MTGTSNIRGGIVNSRHIHKGRADNLYSQQIKKNADAELRVGKCKTLSTSTE